MMQLNKLSQPSLESQNFPDNWEEPEVVSMLEPIEFPSEEEINAAQEEFTAWGLNREEEDEE